MHLFKNSKGVLKTLVKCTAKKKRIYNDHFGTGEGVRYNIVNTEIFPVDNMNYNNRSMFLMIFMAIFCKVLGVRY